MEDSLGILNYPFEFKQVRSKILIMKTGYNVIHVEAYTQYIKPIPNLVSETTLETVSNPFEESASIFMSVGRRKLKDRRDKYQDEDPDIAEEMRKHRSDCVRILK